jgi:hypothetical protein
MPANSLIPRTWQFAGTAMPSQILLTSPIFIIDDVEVDHIVPIAVQGQDENTNLQVVHTRCNRKKGVRLQNEPNILQ